MLHTRASLGDTRKYSMPFTILVIDDDPLILEVATELLAEKGHRALSALGGSEGLTQALAERPDLILLDYHMPRIDGLAVVQRLKADAVTRRIPVVALTSGTGDQANALIRAGCIGFIPKPFEPAEFLQIVDEILNATVGRSQRAGS
jgi:two-component system, cell cycle response regulator DivK